MNKLASPSNMRQAFAYPEKYLVNWFPGHMHKTRTEIREQLKNVHVVMEIRDARLPFSSKNAILEEEMLARNKKRIILFNKCDLANMNLQHAIAQHFTSQYNIPTMFIGAKEGKNVSKIIPACLQHFTITKQFQSLPYTFMVMGIPNVGKSSLINALRRMSKHESARAKEGALPGVTRHLASFVVSTDPHCMLIDTPGVLFPQFEDNEQAFKLALIHAIRDFGSTNVFTGYEEQTLADYLLYQLNVRHQYSYAKYYGLPAPNDDLQQVLAYVMKKYAVRGDNASEKAASLMISHFRQGFLGRVTFDEIKQ